MLSDVGNVPDELVIYVPEVESVDCATPIELLDEEVDDPPAGLRYLLEIPTVKEVLQVWSRWRGGRTPTEDEACEAVVHYAEHDAYLPVE